MPTLCRWAGVPVLAAEVDGVDFTDSLAGNSATNSLPERALVFHYPHIWGPTNGHGYQPHSAIRKGAWKAIWFYESRTWELYNTADDIGESNDLAASQPGKLKELATDLIRILNERDARFPVDLSNGSPLVPSPPGKTSR
jgi:arylsulfatase A-like enzyme